MSIYRRGAVYWWRRTLSCPSRGIGNITIRISLKTANAAEARLCAAALGLEQTAVTVRTDEALRATPTRADLACVYRLAYQAELDRIVVKQAAAPMREDAHAAFNRVYAQLFTWIARSPRPPVPDAALMDELIEAGLDRFDAEKLHLTLQMHSRRGVMPDDLIDGFGVPEGAEGDESDQERDQDARLSGSVRLPRGILDQPNSPKSPFENVRPGWP